MQRDGVEVINNYLKICIPDQVRALVLQGGEHEPLREGKDGVLRLHLNEQMGGDSLTVVWNRIPNYWSYKPESFTTTCRS